MNYKLLRAGDRVLIKPAELSFAALREGTVLDVTEDHANVAYTIFRFWKRSRWIHNRLPEVILP